MRNDLHNYALHCTKMPLLHHDILTISMQVQQRIQRKKDSFWAKVAADMQNDLHNYALHCTKIPLLLYDF
jgi:hypothetical protein